MSTLFIDIGALREGILILKGPEFAVFAVTAKELFRDSLESPPNKSKRPYAEGSIRIEINALIS